MQISVFPAVCVRDIAWNYKKTLYYRVHTALLWFFVIAEDNVNVINMFISSLWYWGKARRWVPPLMACRIRREVENENVLMEMECLDTRFPSAYPAVCGIQREAVKK